MVNNFSSLVILDAGDSTLIVPLQFNEVVGVLDSCKLAFVISQADFIAVFGGDFGQKKILAHELEFVGEAGTKLELERICRLWSA